MWPRLLECHLKTIRTENHLWVTQFCSAASYFGNSEQELFRSGHGICEQIRENQRNDEGERAAEAKERVAMRGIRLLVLSLDSVVQLYRASSTRSFGPTHKLKKTLARLQPSG
jgi:hypothetical protein